MSVIRKLRDRQPKYAGDIAFDFWPVRDWWRFSYKKFRPGQYWQLCVGPIRLEFFSA